MRTLRADDLRLRKLWRIRLYCGRSFGGFHFLVMTKTETNSNTIPKPQVLKLPAPPVIFLNFEGVLVFSDGQWSLEAMQELNRFCLETGAAVVLTTSCRYGCSVEELCQMLLDNGLSENVTVLGETRDLGACAPWCRWALLVRMTEGTPWSYFSI